MQCKKIGFVIGSLSQADEIKKIAEMVQENGFYMDFVKPENKPFADMVHNAFFKISNADFVIALQKPDGTYEYETPVAYWMPFNRGIGFHDATWQSSFGGNRYLSHGSHGCINMPKDKAAALYDLIPEACPVICHY